MTTRYTFDFERIGRHHDLQLTVDTDDVESLPARVIKFALNHLGSRHLDVFIDLDAGTGWIEAGFRQVGSFTVKATEPTGPPPATIPRPMAPLAQLSDKARTLLGDVAAGRVYALANGNPDIWMVGATRANWQQVRALVRRGLVERVRQTDLHDEVRLTLAGRDAYRCAIAGRRSS